MNGPRYAPVRAKCDLHTRVVEPGEIPGLDAEPFLNLRPIDRRLLQCLKLVGGDSPAQPTQVHRHPRIGEVGNQDHVGTLLPERDQLVVDVPVPHAP